MGCLTFHVNAYGSIKLWRKDLALWCASTVSRDNDWSKVDYKNKRLRAQIEGNKMHSVVLTTVMVSPMNFKLYWTNSGVSGNG